MGARDRDTTASRLEALLDATDDGIVTTTLDGTITLWNAGAERLYGFPAAEATGRSILLLFPPERAAEELQIQRAVQRGERVRDVDAVRVDRKGTAVPISLTVVPLRSGDGGVVGTLRVARKVGSRSAERAGRRLAAIVESSDDAIVSKDLNGIVTSWNGAAERMFGFTAEEMIGQSVRLIIPADRQTEEDSVLASIRRGEQVDHFETIRRRKDGSLVPISLTVSPIRDGDGRVIGASKIARDITDKRQVEAELIRLLAIAEQNAAITDKLNQVGAIVASDLDREKIVQAVIDAATDLTRAEFGVFVYNGLNDRGESSTQYAVAGASREVSAVLPAARHQGIFDPSFRETVPVRSRDVTADARYASQAPPARIPGSNLPVRSYLAVPVNARSGERLGGLFFGHSGVGFFDERHERLAAGVASWAAVALENARLYMEVRQASRLKDEFLATLSHELRTPLNAIVGYARMIRDGILGADRRQKAVVTIERNATSLTQIVEDVLDVSRIISGKMRLDVQSVDTSAVIRNAVEAVAPGAEAKGVTLDTHLESDVPVFADPERLQQIVWNLLSNAVKFTGRGGRIDVTSWRAESHVEISVADTGIGIAPEFLPHIFERFRQADSSTTRERGGLGLGLGIAKQLVEMHGGTIEAESGGHGLGSTFRVCLPVMAVRAAPADRSTPLAGDERERSARPRPNLHGLRVLAVDDDRDALNMVREILEAAGADVSTASSGGAALETIAAVHPDVLVADLGMPRMDGFELIVRIRTSADPSVRNVPAAALTAYARSEDRAKAMRSGFQMHLAKPIDPGDLTAAVALLARSARLSPPTVSPELDPFH